MAGWNLKESNLIEEELNYDKLEILIKNIKISKKQNSYKYLLLLILLKSCKNNLKELEMLDITKEIIIFYKTLLKKYNPNLKERQCLLYRNIINSDLQVMEDDYIRKEFKFFENYVYGALAVDTEQIIFGFSKKLKKVYLNKNLGVSLCEKFFEVIFKDMIDEFFYEKKIKKERER